MADVRIPTSLVGSYAQPSWLIDRERLRDRFPPGVRALELWRFDPAWLEEAQDDATRLAIADQERAGLDIVTDGEMRRESYSNRLPPRSTAWTSTTRARRSIAAAIRTRCRAWSGRSAGAIRCRSATSSS